MTGPPADVELTLLRVRIVKSVQRICPAWLASQADDIVQAAMMKLMDALARREEDSPPPSSYYRKVAFSATVDEIRHRRRMREVSLDEAADEPARSPAYDPERLIEARRIAQGVKDCLQRLATPRRLSVNLHLQGHTVRESSQLLGWSVKRVENLVFRGLADLRACLAAKGLKP